MFVGESGIMRVAQRACELMKQHDTDDLRQVGGVDLKMLQRYLNFHYSVSLDLFGSEVSSNAAAYYAAGLKGRYQEEKIADDHRLTDAVYRVLQPKEGRIVEADAPALPALNERLRDDYVADCARGVARWNKAIRAQGIDFELKLPHRAFNRRIGAFAGMHVAPDGRVVSAEAWRAGAREWLPTPEDHAYVGSLMTPVRERGKFANWIAPPQRGIDGLPVDYEYVRFER